MIVDALRGMRAFNAVQPRKRYDVKTESVGGDVTADNIDGLSDEKLAKLKEAADTVFELMGE